MAARISVLKTSADALLAKVDTTLPRKISSGDLNPVGAKTYSMLTEAQFQAQNGSGWVLADGRNVSGSDYHTKTGQTTVPDLRGVHLRGKNNGRADGNQDTAGERSVRSFQNTAIPNILGYAETSYAAMLSTYSGALVTEGSVLAAASTPGYSGSHEVGYLEITASLSNSIYQSVTEARVKNVAVNIFIKINH